MITVVLKTHNQDNPDQDYVVMSKYLQKYKYLQNLQKKYRHIYSGSYDPQSWSWTWKLCDEIKNVYKNKLYHFDSEIAISIFKPGFCAMIICFM